MSKALYVGVSAKRNLPAGYTQVEYIQSSGTQYIDTGFKPTAKTKIVADVEFTQKGSGYYSGYYISPSWFSFGVNSQFEFYMGNTYALGPTAHTNRVTITMDAANKTASVGSDSYAISYSSFTTASYTMPIFAMRRDASTIANHARMKLYSFKIYDNGTLIRDFVPCKNASGTIGLYDMANNKFYANAGTGTFTVGPEVTGDGVARKGKAMYVGAENTEKRNLPSGYTQVGYLVMTGTQYVDLEFKPNQDTKLDIITMPTSVANFAGNGNGFSPYGVSTNYNSNAYECYSQNGQYEFNYDGQVGYVGIATAGHKLHIVQDKNNITVSDLTSGEEWTYAFTYQAFTAPYNLILGGIYRGSAILGAQKIGPAKVYNNGTLVRDCVPCVSANGIAGMYDMATGKFRTNAGTGTFDIGPTLVSGNVARSAKRAYVGGADGVAREFWGMDTTKQVVIYDPYDVKQTFQFEDGMTWREWCASAYNTIGAIMDGNYLLVITEDNVWCWLYRRETEDIVLADEPISESVEYCLLG